MIDGHSSAPGQGTPLSFIQCFRTPCGVSRNCTVILCGGSGTPNSSMYSGVPDGGRIGDGLRNRMVKTSEVSPNAGTSPKTFCQDQHNGRAIGLCHWPLPQPMPRRFRFQGVG